jgi:hypothetical protein
MRLTVKKGNPAEPTQAEKKAISRESKKGVKQKVLKGVSGGNSLHAVCVTIKLIYIKDNIFSLNIFS